MGFWGFGVLRCFKSYLVNNFPGAAVGGVDEEGIISIGIMRSKSSCWLFMGYSRGSRKIYKII